MDNSEQKILTLTDREKCRLRTPVFMGSFDCRMINLNEVLMNARDEVNTNFNSGEIHITLHEDLKTITIRDTGRGIPIRGIDNNGIKKSDLIFKTLFSGCNFENINKTDGDNFIENCGQNGAGLTTTQYISTYFQGTQIINHNAYEVTYRNGGLEEQDREYKSEFSQGTIITYSLDPSVVTNIYYTYEEIVNTVKRVASTTKSKIRYVVHHKGEDLEFKYESFEDYLQENCESTLSDILHFNEKNTIFESSRDGQSFREGNRLEILISLSASPFQETYLNGGYLPEQGTIYKGIIEGLKKFFQKEIKGKTKLTDNDIIMSFNIYSIMGSNNPVYSNQTKKSASNQLYRKICTDYILENMEIVKIEKPKLFDSMQKHLVTINSFNTKNEESVKNIKKKLETKTSLFTKIPNLIECQSKDTKKNILCICEGKSALGSLLKERRSVHAIYPLRGKILNCLKATPSKILENEIIGSLIQALGCGVEINDKAFKSLPRYNAENLRYCSIDIFVDQDYDGIGSIMPLLLTVFYVLIPSFIKEGRLYLCETPKYEVVCGDKEYYATNDEELEALKEKLKGKKYDIHYIKGLAELSDEAVKLCMSEGYINRKQLMMRDVEESIRSLELWMGDDIEPRKDFILSNFNKGSDDFE